MLRLKKPSSDNGCVKSVNVSVQPLTSGCEKHLLQTGGENMPTLLVDEKSFSPTEKRILTKTFNSNCRDLGISGHDCSVELRKVDLGERNKHGGVNRLTPDRFLIVLNSNGFELFDASSALGHEAVHIGQYLKGTMAEDPDGTFWEGNFYPTFLHKPLYDQLPWEKDAFGKQGKLHKRALRNLLPDEVHHVFNSSPTKQWMNLWK
jgi:hypothetical protein